MLYNFSVEGLNIQCTNHSKIIISDSVNFHTAHFDFSNEWLDYSKTIVFTNSSTEKSVFMILDEDNNCVIPWESLEMTIDKINYNVTTRLVVAVHGVEIDGDKEVWTFMRNPLVLVKSDKSDYETPTDPSKDIITQIIEKIDRLDETKQDKYLIKKTYDSVLYDDESSLYYGKIRPINYETPWSVRLRVTSEIENVSGSEQYADLYISSTESNLGSFETKNTVYDSTLNGIENNILYLLTEEGYYQDLAHLLGIEISEENRDKPRKVSVELYESQNALVEFYNNPKKINEISSVDKYSDAVFMNFTDNGVFTNNMITKEDLSVVALSGSYNDLLDKPLLLDLLMDETSDTLIFTKQ
ncbi:MAG: hypothetical protein KBT03_06540 [Bacteroidales bacterium]|nr:hypothetical protein [Candidatus Scybalousia scybalohippi]